MMKLFSTAFFLVLLGFTLLLPFAPVLAADAPATPADAPKGIDLVPCGEVSLTSLANLFNLACIGKLIAWILFIVVQLLTTLLVWAGLLFDLVIQKALAQTTYTSNVLKAAWGTARDACNLFFIFILLAISIGTILRVEQYGIKKVLPRLVISALLINFSFIIAQYIIFTSNAFASYFLPQQTRNNQAVLISEKLGAGFQFQRFFAGPAIATLNKNEIDELKQLRKQQILSENLLSDADQKRLDELQSKQSAAFEAQEKLTNNADTGKIVVNAIISEAFGIIFFGIAVFVYATLAVMMLYRIVAVWFLMMLSPFAFLLRILDRTSSWAKKWWDDIIDQAVWPIAFLIFLNITIQMVTQLNADNKPLTTFDGHTTIESLSLKTILTYVATILMLLFSVKMARQLGARGGEFVMKQGQKISGWAQGKVYRGAKGAGGLAWRGTGGLAGRGALAAAAPLAKSATEGRLAQVLRSPIAKYSGVGALATRGATAVLVARRKRVEDKAKTYERMSSAEIKSQHAVTLDDENKAAMISVLAKRKDLKPDEKRNFTSAAIQKNIENMKTYGVDTKDADTLRMQFMSEDDFKKKPDGPKHAQKVIRGLSQKRIKQIVAEGGEEFNKLKAVFEAALVDVAKGEALTFDVVIAGLQKLDAETKRPLNAALAKFFDSNAAQPVLDALELPTRTNQNPKAAEKTENQPPPAPPTTPSPPPPATPPQTPPPPQNPLRYYTIPPAKPVQLAKEPPAPADEDEEEDEENEEKPTEEKTEAEETKENEPPNT